MVVCYTDIQSDPKELSTILHIVSGAIIYKNAISLCIAIEPIRLNRMI